MLYSGPGKQVLFNCSFFASALISHFLFADATDLKECSVNSLSRHALAFDDFLIKYYLQQPLIITDAVPANNYANQAGFDPNVSYPISVGSSAGMVGAQEYSRRRFLVDSLLQDLLAQTDTTVSVKHTFPSQLNQAFDLYAENMRSKETMWHFFSPQGGTQFHRSFNSFFVRGDTGSASLKMFFYGPSMLPPLQHRPKMGIHEWFVSKVYPLLQSSEYPGECELQPGDMLYMPEDWWIAWMNTHGSVKVLAQKRTTTPMSDVFRERILMGKAWKKKNISEFMHRVARILQVEPNDLGAHYERARVTSIISTSSIYFDNEAGAKSRKAILSRTNQRSCDAQHQIGRLHLRKGNATAAKAAASLCIQICDQFAKCFDLLASAIQTMKGGRGGMVVQQARELARQYRAPKMQAKLMSLQGEL